MIDKLLNLTRPLFVLDCETTGVDPQKDRVVEIGLQRWEADGMTKEWRSLVNPGVPIPEAATRVHGITDAMVTTLCKYCQGARDTHEADQVALGAATLHPWTPAPSFSQLAPNLAKGLSGCDFAGKNVRFDLRVLAAEFARVGVEWSYAGARIVDAERLEQLAVPRTLSHLHEKYVGRKHDGAHGALSDVRASATVIARQLQDHQALPRDLDQLHALQWPGWLCDSGQFKMVDGVATCTFGKHRGRPMRELPTDYYDWILASDFPADVKALAREAKMGRFPA